MCDIKERETLRAQNPRLRQQVHEAIRRLHYSRRTEEAYVHWIKRFILFHLQKNIQMLKGNLPGNMYFLLPIALLTRDQG